LLCTLLDEPIRCFKRTITAEKVSDVPVDPSALIGVEVLKGLIRNRVTVLVSNDGRESAALVVGYLLSAIQRLNHARARGELIEHRGRVRADLISLIEVRLSLCGSRIRGSRNFVCLAATAEEVRNRAVNALGLRRRILRTELAVIKELARWRSSRTLLANDSARKPTQIIGRSIGERELSRAGIVRRLYAVGEFLWVRPDALTLSAAIS
jgi:hypothetical protein